MSLNNVNKFCPYSTEEVLCGQKEDWTGNVGLQCGKIIIMS